MLTLSLLGSFELYRDERPFTQLSAQKAQALLIYLAVESRQVHQRDTLMALLWPDYPQKSAQQSLRQTLYLLRQAIEPDNTNTSLILAERFTVALNPEAALVVDVTEFEQLSGIGRSPLDWQQATDLYRGHFLADFYLPDSEPFEEWAANKRAFYQRRVQELLQRLADYYVQVGDYAAAEMAVRRQLALDNLQEAAHRQLMEVLVRNGRRQEALSHYQTLQRLLQTELDIEPDAQTMALIEAIRTGELYTKLPTFISDDKPKRPRHNLPHLLTSFIGREKEIAEITDLITSNRLVMLTGVGGIGKTALSLRVGHQVLETFPDGVWLVELASVMDEILVAQTVLYALGLRESSNRPILDVLFEFLREKECLLVFDNCEHLIQAVAQFVQSILQACPRLKILANSREILDIPGERPFYVPPLSMPTDQQLPALNQWPQYEAMRLFVDRAITIFPEYQVTDDNLAPLVQICQQLDGIPLALELAAARVKMLTTEQIAIRLDQRFRLLTTSKRMALPRQQTLQALVDWSWELLSPGEQALLRRLSVFAGGMTLATVAAICTDDGVHEIEVLDLLAQLVNKSLLIAEREQGKEIRYHLLETIRQYGQERLAEADEVIKFRQRHLDYFLRWGEQAEQELYGPRQIEWLNHLGVELDNLRAALSFAQKIDVEAGLRLSTALWKFWEAEGYIREGETWLDQMLEDANSVNQSIKARALGVQSHLRLNLFNFDLARANAEECLALYRKLDDQEGVAFGLNRLARLVTPQGDLELAMKFLSESLSIYRASGNRLGEAESLEFLGQIEGVYKGDLVGDYGRSRAYLEESLAIYQLEGHLIGTSSILFQLGWTAMRQGEYEVARSWIESEKLTALFNARPWSGGFMVLGELNFRLTEYEQARMCFERCIELSQHSGEKSSEFWALVRLAYVFLRMDDIVRAQKCFIESQQNFVKVGSTDGVVYALEGLASLAVGQDQPERAVRLFAWSDSIRESIQDVRPPVEQADVDRDIATIREMIDAETYAVAYAAGKEMTMGEAIALALGVGDGETAV